MKETPTDPAMDVVHVEPDARRALRRALELRCDVVSHYWEQPVQHMISDVSPYGAWIDTLFPLHPGAEVVLGFRPPSWEDSELLVFAKVTRVVTGRLRGDRGRIGMGLEFVDLGGDELDQLERCLKGVPPRMKPRHTAKNLLH